MTLASVAPKGPRRKSRPSIPGFGFLCILCDILGRIRAIWREQNGGTILECQRSGLGIRIHLREEGSLVTVGGFSPRIRRSPRNESRTPPQKEENRSIQENKVPLDSSNKFLPNRFGLCDRSYNGETFFL